MENKYKNLTLLFALCAVCCMLCAVSYAASLDRAEILYLQRRYSDSIEECAALIGGQGNSEYACYLLGLNYLKLNDAAKAREKLNYFLDKPGKTRYEDAARLAYADTYFIEQNYAEAEQNYENLLQKNSSLKSALYLRLGQCALELGNWKKAKGYFGILKQSYPLSLEAFQAATLSENGDYFFTVQVGSFAKSANAYKLADKLKKKNFDSYIDELDTQERKLFRVRVGKLKSREEAEDLRNLLEREGCPTKIFP